MTTKVTKNLVNAVQSDVKTDFTVQQNFNANTLTDGATINWDLNTHQVASITLSVSGRVVAAPTNMVDGGTYILRIKQDEEGFKTLTWDPVFKWPGGTVPILSGSPNALDILTFTSDGTNMYGVIQKGFS